MSIKKYDTREYCSTQFVGEGKRKWWMICNEWGREDDSDLECVMLQRLAYKKDVLEVGAFKGRSTLAIAESAKRVMVVGGGLTSPILCMTAP